MKKLIFYFLFFCFFKLYSSLAWGYEVNFKSKITCDLFVDGKKFTTKTWPLDTDKDGGYLTDKSLNNIKQQLQKRGKLNGRVRSI